MNDLAHEQSVVGVYVNEVNRLTVTIGNYEVRFWSFHTHDFLQELKLPNVASISRFHREK